MGENMSVVNNIARFRMSDSLLELPRDKRAMYLKILQAKAYISARGLSYRVSPNGLWMEVIKP